MPSTAMISLRLTPCVGRRSRGSMCAIHASRRGVSTIPDDGRGVFQNLHVKAFPVRAAIDVGTGGVASLCIARVDAAHMAIQKTLYQTQLPLFLDAGDMIAEGGGSFRLSEASIINIMNKLRILHGAMRRDAYEGLSERAGVLSWPVCEATNAEELAARIQREFGIHMLVLGKNFHAHAEWCALPNTEETNSPISSSPPSVDSDVASAEVNRRKRKPWLKKLVKAKEARRVQKKQLVPQHTSAMGATFLPAQKQSELLAFMAVASMAHCVRPQRMLLIHDDPARGLSIVGADSTTAFDMQDLLAESGSEEERQALLGRVKSFVEADGEPTETLHGRNNTTCNTRAELTPLPTSTSSALAEHRLPLDVAAAHRHCIVDVQRRAMESYSSTMSSPNPLLASEFSALRSLLAGMMEPTLPAWVRRKSSLGGVIAGTGYNGSILNSAARIAQKTSISLHHLEVHSLHHFCGLTDVLLSQNFPNPLQLLPSAALCCALMDVLKTPRVQYVPEVSIAAALLTQPHLWAYHHQTNIRTRLAPQPFYRSAAHRTYSRPKDRTNPNAAPNATAATHASWDSLSYRESMKGT